MKNERNSDEDQRAVVLIESLTPWNILKKIVDAPCDTLIVADAFPNVEKDHRFTGERQKKPSGAAEILKPT